MSNTTGCNSCKQTEPSNIQKINILINYFPFLKNEFRELKENELKSETVFKELFQDNKVVDFGLLKAVIEFQRLQKLGK